MIPNKCFSLSLEFRYCKYVLLTQIYCYCVNSCETFQWISYSSANRVLSGSNQRIYLWTKKIFDQVIIILINLILTKTIHNHKFQCGYDTFIIYIIISE